MDHQMVSNNVKGQEKYSREATCDNIKTLQQAGAELCQAQLKLGLDFNQILRIFGCSLFDLVELVKWTLHFRLD